MALAHAAAEHCEIPPSPARSLSNDEAAELAARFAALGDPARVRIVHRLLGAGQASVCVCDLVALLGLSQPAVSYHLKILRDAGILQRERRGSFAHYRLAGDVLRLLAEPLYAAAGASDGVESSLEKR
jgi:ArsR family transcriptional regulator